MMRRAHLRIEDLSLMAILLIAAFPRLWDIGAIRHNIDHAYTIWQALDTLEHGTLPVIGQSTSVLFANPALTGYLFVPVLALTRSAAAVYVLVIALNTAGVYFCYRTAADLTGKRWLGLIAAWLMAVNPWVIEFSRTTWVQCLLPFLMSFVAWLLFPVLLGSARRPDRRLAAALAAAAVIALTWLLAFFIAAPIAALLLIFRRNVPRKGFLIGAGMCAAATAIFVIGLLSNPAAGFARAGNFTSGAARLKSDALLHAIRLVTGTEYSSVKGAALADAGAWQTADLVVHYGLLALLVLGIAFTVNALRKPNPMRGAAVIVLIWFFLPVAAMSYNGSPIHPHYMLLTLPAGFVLAAWGAEFVMRNTVSRVLVGAFLIGAGMVSGGNSLRAAYETRVAPGDDVALGIPLEAGLRVGAAINAYRPEGAVVFANIEPWVLSSLAGQTLPVVQETRAPAASIVPKGGGVYVTLTRDEAAIPKFAQEAERVTLANGYRFTISVFAAGGADLSAVTHPMEVRSMQGITFAGYDLRPNARGTAVTLTTYWRVDAADPQSNRDAFGMFAHIFDASGQRIEILDGRVIPGYLWNVGDVHVHQIRIRPPEAGDFTVGVGQYDGGQNKNVEFVMADQTTTTILMLEP